MILLAGSKVIPIFPIFWGEQLILDSDRPSNIRLKVYVLRTDATQFLAVESQAY